MTSTTDSKIAALEQQLAALSASHALVLNANTRIIKLFEEQVQPQFNNFTAFMSYSGSLEIFLLAMIQAVAKNTGVTENQISTFARQLAELPDTEKSVANAIYRFLPLFEKKASDSQDAADTASPLSPSTSPPWLRGVYQDGILVPPPGSPDDPEGHS